MPISLGICGLIKPQIFYGVRGIAANSIKNLGFYFLASPYLQENGVR
jgi:hypothetical protein